MSDTPRIDALLENATWLHGLARQMLADRDLAADAVQETWIAALGRRDEPDPGKPWLARVLRNFARQRGRSETARRAREQRVARPEPRPSTVETVARAELHAKLVHAVLALEEPFRTAILWRYFDDCSDEEIARRAGIDPATVRSRLTRARAKLRERLSDDGGDAPERWLTALLPVGADVGRAGALAGGTLAGIGGGLMSTKFAAVVVVVALVVTALVWRAVEGDASAGQDGALLATAPAHAERPADELQAVSAPSASNERTSATSDAAGATAVADRAATWHGTVLGEDGRRAIEGARISYRRGSEIAEDAQYSAASRTREMTRSDADGRFELPISADAGDGLWIEADDYFAYKLAPGDLPRDRATPIEVVLAPLGTLELEIVDDALAPHADLAVRYAIDVNRGSQDFAWSYRRDFAAGRTDGAGRLSIANLPCGMPIDLRQGERALGATFLGVVHIDPRARRLHHVVKLARTATIRGRLELASKLRANFIAVEWRSYPLGYDEPVRANTDEDGRFEIAKLAPKRGELRVDAPGLAPRELELHVGETIDVGTIVVPELFALSGRLRNRWMEGELDDHAFADFEVRAMRDGRVIAPLGMGSERDEGGALGVENGLFRTVVTDGPLELVVSRGGHWSYGMTMPREVLARVALPEPQTDLEIVIDGAMGALDVELGPNVSAYDPPLSVRLYRLVDAGPEPQFVTVAGRASSERRIRFAPIAPGLYRALLHSSAGSAVLGDVAIEAARATSVVAPAFEGFALAGDVRDAQGEPVSRATVSWRSADGQNTNATDAAGHFRIEGLTCGLVDLEVRHGDFGVAELRDIPLFAPEARVAVVLDGFATLAGRVRIDGAPAARLSIDAQRVGSNHTYNAITDGEGRFRLERLPACRLRVWSSGKFVEVYDLAAGRVREVEIDVGAPRLVCFAREGEPIDDLYAVRALALDGTASGASRWRSGVLRPGGTEIDTPGGRVLFDVSRARMGSNASFLALVDRPGSVVEMARHTLVIDRGAPWNGLLPRANLVGIEDRPVVSMWGGEIALAVERDADGRALVPCLPDGSRVRLTGFDSRGQKIERIVDVPTVTSVSWP